MKTKEHLRLEENYAEKKEWLKWGPYLSERQWGTVREDYSEHGEAWDFFPHDHARSRTYRWGEDGLAGISDKYCNLCFAVALWNGNDPIIKERMFGLTGPEGNHGEDVKELYYYLDSTPTHSYMKHLYKYPQAAYPYADLVETNARRSKTEPEYELLDTGVFENNEYFDVFTEYAKADADDILIKITVHNRGAEKATCTVLPTLWFRNLWSYDLMDEKPNLKLLEAKKGYGCVAATHEKIGAYYLYFETPERTLFTENESNNQKLFASENNSAFVKDSINDAVVSCNFEMMEGNNEGTKCSPLFRLEIEGEQSQEIRLRLSKKKAKTNPLKATFTRVFADRVKDADDFYKAVAAKNVKGDLKNIQRQAFAGMLWTKQYYNIDIPRWLKGDPNHPAPPLSRKSGRNSDWMTLNNEDIISMPDKWQGC